MSGTTIQLRDGRTIGYAEFGDPQGTPVLWCHGGPGSRIESSTLGPAAAELGLRLVGIDRPGYGKSTPMPGRTPPSPIVEAPRSSISTRVSALGAADGSKMFAQAPQLAPSDLALLADPEWLAAMPKLLAEMFAFGVQGYVDDRLADGPGWGTFDVSLPELASLL